MYCGAVPQIRNGYISNVTSVQLGGSANYTCIDGYDLTLDPNGPLICASNGSWVNVPSCTGKQNSNTNGKL